MKAEESLQIIESMIQEAKNEFAYNGFHFLLWGWLVMAAAVVNYILLVVVDYPNHWVAWPILMGAGGVITAVVSIRDKSKRTAQSLLNRVMSQLWIAVLLGLAVLLFIMPQLGILNAYPIFILLYGIGTFATGRILKFNPLVIGGVVCFLLAGFSAYQTFPNQLILIATAILISYIIPGHLLFNKSKNNV